MNKLMILLVAALFGVCVCLEEITTQTYWYKPFTDDPEEVARNMTIRKQLIEKIVPLGRSVQMIIETLPKGDGKKLMKELDEFNDLNQQFLDLVKDDKQNSKSDVDYLHDKSYPHLVDTDFSEEKMKDNFNWTSSEVEEFYKKRVIANDHYIDLQLYHHWYH